LEKKLPSACTMADQLSSDQLAILTKIYSGAFNIGIRVAVGDWIELQIVPILELGPSPISLQDASALTNEVVQLLHAKISAMPMDNDFSSEDKGATDKNMLLQAADILQDNVESDPIQAFDTILQCVKRERAIVKMGALEVELQQMNLDIESYRAEQEDLSVSVNDCQKKKVDDVHWSFENKELDDLEESLNQKLDTLNKHQTSIFNKLEALCNSVKQVEDKIVDEEMNNWKKEQMRASNGIRLDDSGLNVLQVCFEKLAIILVNALQHTQNMNGLKTKSVASNKAVNDFNGLGLKVTEMLRTLLSSSLVIVKQPPHVIKKKANVEATLRFLTGNALSFQAAPVVKVAVVSDQQADALVFSDSPSPWKDVENLKCGDIVNNQETAEFNSSTNKRTCWFKNMHVKRIKRPERKADKKGADRWKTVLDEKYALLFCTQFLAANLKFQLWTLSLPVVITAHGNQEEQAMSTILWDRGFAQWGRRCFQVADKVKWGDIAKVLDQRWRSACGTRGLTEDNLYNLATKAFRNKNLPRDPEIYNNMELSRALFCKDDLPTKAGKDGFTFWELFHQALLITSKHLKELWENGYVIGFVKREEAQATLNNHPRESFLLRFSDSTLGSISIAFRNRGMEEAHFLQPFTMEDLEKRSLVDRLMDIPDLDLMYPDIPKETLREYAPIAPARNDIHISCPCPCHRRCLIGCSCRPQPLNDDSLYEHRSHFVRRKTICSNLVLSDPASAQSEDPVDELFELQFNDLLVNETFELLH